jgi:hypothetical protein
MDITIRFVLPAPQPSLPAVVVQDFAEAAKLVREQTAREPDTQVQAWLGGLELAKEAIAQLKKPKGRSALGIAGGSNQRASSR